MKKLAIGCLAMVVLVVAAAAIGSFYAYRKVTSTVAGFTELAKVPDLERSIRNQSQFAAPASGELTAQQLQRYLAVQQAIQTRLGVRVQELERTYQTLLEKDEAELLDVPKVIAAYRDVAATFLEAKQTQVDALNDAGLSLDEYRWIRGQVYSALGMPMAEIDIAGIIDAVKAGRTPNGPSMMVRLGGRGGPEVNRRLVTPHRKQLEDSAALALFGL